MIKFEKPWFGTPNECPNHQGANQTKYRIRPPCAAIGFLGGLKNHLKLFIPVRRVLYEAILAQDNRVKQKDNDAVHIDLSAKYVIILTAAGCRGGRRQFQ